MRLDVVRAAKMTSWLLLGRPSESISRPASSGVKVALPGIGAFLW